MSQRLLLRQGRRFKIMLIFGLPLVALVLAFGGCQREEPAQPPKHPATASKGSYDRDIPVTKGGQPVDVQVIRATRRPVVYTITLPGNIAPLYQTTLYAKVSGYLKWIGPDKGDTVKKNQVLAIIDAPEVEEQYQQAIADYKIKKITYDRLSNVLKETPDVIAKQDVDVSEAALEGAKHLMEQRVALRDYTKVRAPYDGT